MDEKEVQDLVEAHRIKTAKAIENLSAKEFAVADSSKDKLALSLEPYIMCPDTEKYKMENLPPVKMVLQFLIDTMDLIEQIGTDEFVKASQSMADEQ